MKHKNNRKITKLKLTSGLIRFSTVLVKSTRSTFSTDIFTSVVTGWNSIQKNSKSFGWSAISDCIFNKDASYIELIAIMVLSSQT